MSAVQKGVTRESLVSWDRDWDFSCYLCSFSVESISQDEAEIQANAPRMWRRFVSVTVCYAADSAVQL